jgi:hypothetical protein
MKLLLLIFLNMLTVVSSLMAQSAKSSYAIYFKSNEAVLDANDIAALHPILVHLKGPYYAEVNLTAHTDFEASDDYNQTLSEKRCQAVKSYLLANGVSESRIIAKSFGESKPKVKAKTDYAKSLNRRVEIELQIFEAQTVQDFLGLIGKDKKQEFKVNASKPITLVGKGGLKIEIPADGFVFANGDRLTSNEVNITLEELFKPGDAFTHQLSTMSDGKMLESGGMFSIEVRQGARQLKLKEGANMMVKLPSNNIVNGMQVFLPVVNDSTGIKEWKPTANSFELEPVKKVSLPFVYIDTNALRRFKINEEPGVSMPNLKYGSIPWPIKPACPKAPSLPVIATKKDLFNVAERFFISKAVLEKEVLEVNQARQLAYQKAFKKWQQRCASYEVTLSKYKVDSAEFEYATRDAFFQWLQHTEEQLHAYLTSMEIQFFNEGVERFCRASSMKKLTSLNLRTVFLKAARPTVVKSKHIAQVRSYLNFIQQLKSKSMADIIKYAGDKNHMIHLDSDRLKKNIIYFTNDYYNSFAMNMIERNPELKNIFIKVEGEIIDKRESAGLLDNKDVAMIYSASLGSTGLYNCDRFSNVPPTQMARIYIDAPQNARVSFYVPDINSYIYAYSSRNGYYVDLPKNKKVKLMAFALNENAEPLLGQTELIVKEETRLAPNFERVTVKELRLRLANI